MKKLKSIKIKSITNFIYVVININLLCVSLYCLHSILFADNLLDVLKIATSFILALTLSYFIDKDV